MGQNSIHSHQNKSKSWFSRSRVTKSEVKNRKVLFLQSHPSDRAATPGDLSYGGPWPAATGFTSRKIQSVPSAQLIGIEVPSFSSLVIMARKPAS